MPKQGDPEAPPACRWCGDWPALWTLNDNYSFGACIENRWKPGDKVGTDALSLPAVTGRTVTSG